MAGTAGGHYASSKMARHYASHVAIRLMLRHFADVDIEESDLNTELVQRLFTTNNGEQYITRAALLISERREERC